MLDKLRLLWYNTIRKRENNKEDKTMMMMNYDWTEKRREWEEKYNNSSLEEIRERMIEIQKCDKPFALKLHNNRWFSEVSEEYRVLKALKAQK